MIDARINAGLPAHPKTKKLIRRLGDTGAWRLVCLFLWVASNRPDGDLSGMTAEDIELSVDWPGEEGAFIKALKEVGFLEGEEGEFRVHDWTEHNPWAAGSEDRSKSARFAALCKRYGRERAEEIVSELADRKRKVCTTSAPFQRTACAPDATRTNPHSETDEFALRPIESRTAPSPNPSPNPNPNPNPSPNPNHEPSETARRVFDHWRREMGHERAQFDDKRRRLVNTALKLGYSADDLVKAISGYKNSPHHMGQNDRGARYDSLELILRDAGHIDQGLRFFGQPPKPMSRQAQVEANNQRAVAEWMHGADPFDDPGSGNVIDGEAQEVSHAGD